MPSLVAERFHKRRSGRGVNGRLGARLPPRRRSRPIEPEERPYAGQLLSWSNWLASSMTGLLDGGVLRPNGPPRPLLDGGARVSAGEEMAAEALRPRPFQVLAGYVA